MSVKTGYVEAWHELRAYIAERLLGLAAQVAGNDRPSGCHYIQHAVNGYFELQYGARTALRSGTGNVTKDRLTSTSGPGGSADISEMLKHGIRQ